MIYVRYSYRSHNSNNGIVSFPLVGSVLAVITVVIIYNN